MIINPSPWFKKKFPEPAIWVYVAQDNCDTRYMWQYGCNHGRNMLRVDDGQVHRSEYWVVQLDPDILKYDKRAPNYGIRFFTGQCEVCKRIYWMCENFDWIPYLTDRDSVEMILQSVGFEERYFKSMIVPEGRRLFFGPQGEFDRNYTERCNR